MVLIFIIAWIIIFYKPKDYDGDSLTKDSVELFAVIDDISGINKTKITAKSVTYTDKTKFCDGIIIYSEDLPNNLCIGNIVRLKGATYGFFGPTNPGQFNELNYYTAQDIQCRMFAKEIVILDDNKDIIAEGIRNLRSGFIKTAYKCLPEEYAGVAAAMVAGERSGLDDEIKRLYTENGIAHILAISALHITLIGAGLFYFLRRFIMPMRAAAIATGAVIFLYGQMTGFPIATKRAVTMMIIMLIARIVGERYDRLNALAIAAIAELVIHPAALYETGFLLSYGTVFGITVFMRAFSGLISNSTSTYKRAVFEIISASLGINLLTLPIIINSYHEVAVFSVVANIILLPLLGLLLGSGIVAGIAGMINIYLGRLLFGAAYYILWFYQSFCEIITDISFSTLIMGHRSTESVIIYYAGLIIFAIVMEVYLENVNMHKDFSNPIIKYLGESKHKNKLIIFAGRNVKKGAALLIILCVIFLFSPAASEAKNKGLDGKRLSITNIDVGQGDCSVIRAGDVCFMIDGGSTSENDVGRYRIIPYLKYMGIDRLDFVFVTHSDADHVSGILEIVEDKKHFGIDMGRVVLPRIDKPDNNYLELEKTIKENDVDIAYIQKGDELEFNGSGDMACTVRCLHPYPDYAWEDANDYSTVLEIEYGDFEGLFTGDLGEHGESAIADELRDVDYLKVGHHGSRFSSTDEFLDRLRPEIAVASAGKNNRYGHPSPEAIKRLTEHGASFYSTTTSGAVTVSTDGREVTVEEYK